MGSTASQHEPARAPPPPDQSPEVQLHLIPSGHSLKVALKACQLSGTPAGKPLCVAMGLSMLSTPQFRGPGMAFPDLASGFYKELFISTEAF